MRRRSHGLRRRYGRAMRGGMVDVFTKSKWSASALGDIDKVVGVPHASVSAFDKGYRLRYHPPEDSDYREIEARIYRKFGNAVSVASVSAR